MEKEGEDQPLILTTTTSSCFDHSLEATLHQMRPDHDDIQHQKSIQQATQTPAASLIQVCNNVKTCGLSQTTIADSASKAHIRNKLFLAMAFCLVFMVVELVGGIMANSLAILADAAHLLSDIASFTVSLFAVWASGWKPTQRWSYGFHRLEILGALVSVLIIWLVTGILVYEAAYRLVHEIQPINGKLMFFVAVIGFFANLVMIFILGHDHGHHDHHHHHHHQGHDHEAQKDQRKLSEATEPVVNLNLRGAYLHILGDLIQSVGVLVGAAVIWLNPQWRFVDVICTLVFSVVVVLTTVRMVRDVVVVLMEGSPRGIDAEVVRSEIAKICGVIDVHELHIWSATVGKVLLSCHVTAKADVRSEAVLEQVISYCELQHGIRHVTVQIEKESSLNSGKEVSNTAVMFARSSQEQQRHW